MTNTTSNTAEVLILVSSKPSRRPRKVKPIALSKAALLQLVRWAGAVIDCGHLNGWALQSKGLHEADGTIAIHMTKGAREISGILSFTGFHALKVDGVLHTTQTGAVNAICFGGLGLRGAYEKTYAPCRFLLARWEPMR